MNSGYSVYTYQCNTYVSYLFNIRINFSYPVVWTGVLA